MEKNMTQTSQGKKGHETEKSIDRSSQIQQYSSKLQFNKFSTIPPTLSSVCPGARC